MRKLPANMTRVIVGIVVLAVVVGVVFFIVGGSSSKSVTAKFSSAVGVYPGTAVKILGIDVGSVTKVKPEGDSVAITMEYDSKYKLPADAVSLVVANSLVSDRYIQLQPAYSGKGPTLPSGHTIPLSRTASPAELDDIYGALNKLSVALGPTGANKTGALSTLIDVSAANLQGNGAALGTSITELSRAAKTLSDGRADLFGTVKNLQVFTQALSDSDTQVRHFEEQLAQVASDLANERADLGSALHNLGGALNAVASFVKTNASKAHTDIKGLEVVTNVLVKERASLNETLAVAPVALANIVHAYQPNIGVIPTRGNLDSLSDPGQVCGLLNGLAALAKTKGLPAGTLNSIFGPQTSKIESTCIAFARANPGAPGVKLPTGTDLSGALGQLTGGGVGGLIGAGGV